VAHTRILLVEDTRIHTRIIQRCLGNDYELAAESTAEDAIPRLVRESFDLLIIDWSLPGADGINLIQTIRKDLDFQSIPVIMQTAKDRAEHVSRARSAGVDDYIVKPVNCASLQEKVQALLNARSSSSGP
jgi:DNA-binding response OmpR family regulator